MRKHLAGGAVTLLLCLFVLPCCAQAPPDTTQELTRFPRKFIDRLSRTTTRMDRQLSRQTENYMRRLARQENKLRTSLQKLDPASADLLFRESPQNKYAGLAQRLMLDSARTAPYSMGPEYLPYADSAQLGISFLAGNARLLSTSGIPPAAVQQSLQHLTQLETRLQDADQAKAYIASRTVQIQQVLDHYSHLPNSITASFAGYKARAYYYSEQVRQYRQSLNDPDKMLRSALVVLNKLPAFTSFARSHSFLAGLFAVPPGYGEEAGATGLQTRDQVLAMIQQQVGQGGAGGTAALQSSLATAGAAIDKLHSKLSSLGAGSGDIPMPDFKPNPQRTRSFLHRIEWGTNIQTTHATNFLPTYTDIGLSIGYKLDPYNIIGVGASYKLGWGSDIRHVVFSSQGAGLRSFADIHLKKSFSISGGYELNYLSAIRSFQNLRNLNTWSQSGLIGISKSVSMKNRLFKKTKLQLLWDFLSYSQKPKTSPVVFRVGYAF